MRHTSIFRLEAVHRDLPVEYYILASPRPDGEIIGHLAEHPIADAVVDAEGIRYRYVGIARRDASGGVDIGALRPGEWIVPPGLVYAHDVNELCPIT